MRVNVVVERKKEKAREGFCGWICLAEAALN